MSSWAAEQALALWTDIVRDEDRGWVIHTTLFAHDPQQIGVAVGVPGHRRVSARYPAQDFTLDKLRAAVHKLGEQSKEAPFDG